MLVISMIPGKYIGLDGQYLEYVVDGAAIILAFAVGILRHPWSPYLLMVSMNSIAFTYYVEDSYSHWWSLLFLIFMRFIWLHILWRWNTTTNQPSGYS
jgi:hypothetical protein